MRLRPSAVKGKLSNRGPLFARPADRPRRVLAHPSLPGHDAARLAPIGSAAGGNHGHASRQNDTREAGNFWPTTTVMAR
jgi:hypothetical protein